MVLQVVDLKITHQNQSQYIDRKTIYRPIRIKKLYRFPHLLQNIYSCSRLNAIGDLVHKCMGEIRKKCKPWEKRNKPWLVAKSSTYSNWNQNLRRILYTFEYLQNQYSGLGYVGWNSPFSLLRSLPYTTSSATVWSVTNALNKKISNNILKIYNKHLKNLKSNAISSKM